MRQRNARRRLSRTHAASQPHHNYTAAAAAATTSQTAGTSLQSSDDGVTSTAPANTTSKAPSAPTAESFVPYSDSDSSEEEETLKKLTFTETSGTRPEGAGPSSVAKPSDQGEQSTVLEEPVSNAGEDGGLPLATHQQERAAEDAAGPAVAPGGDGVPAGGAGNGAAGQQQQQREEHRRVNGKTIVIRHDPEETGEAMLERLQNLVEQYNQVVERHNQWRQALRQAQAGDRPEQQAQAGNRPTPHQAGDIAQAQARDSPAQQAQAGDRPEQQAQAGNRPNPHQAGDTAQAQARDSPAQQAQAGDRPEQQAGDRPEQQAQAGNRPEQQAQASNRPTPHQAQAGDTAQAQARDSPAQQAQAGDRPTQRAQAGDRPTSQHAGGSEEGAVPEPDTRDRSSVEQPDAEFRQESQDSSRSTGQLVGLEAASGTTSDSTIAHSSQSAAAEAQSTSSVGATQRSEGSPSATVSCAPGQSTNRPAAGNTFGQHRVVLGDLKNGDLANGSTVERGQLMDTNNSVDKRQANTLPSMTDHCYGVGSSSRKRCHKEPLGSSTETTQHDGLTATAPKRGRLSNDQSKSEPDRLPVLHSHAPDCPCTDSDNGLGMPRAPELQLCASKEPLPSSSSNGTISLSASSTATAATNCNVTPANSATGLDRTDTTEWHNFKRFRNRLERARNRDHGNLVDSDSDDDL